MPKKKKSGDESVDDDDFGDQLLEMVRTQEDEETIPTKDFRLPKEFPDVHEGKGIFREKIERPPQKIYLPKITMHQNQVSETLKQLKYTVQTVNIVLITKNIFTYSKGINNLPVDLFLFFLFQLFYAY